LLKLAEDKADVGALIAGGMGLSLHWFPEKTALSSLAEVLAGMANGEGGTIIIGVSPRAGELIGITDLEEAAERVFQACLMIDPVLVLPLPQVVSTRQVEGDRFVSLMVILVPSGLPHVYNLDGRYFGREGTHTTPLTARKLYALLQQRGALQFETRIVHGAQLEDLDTDQVLAYAHQAANLPLGDLVKAYDFLVRRGCLRQVGEQLQVTHAALLLFGRYPEQWLPNATILAGKFPGTVLSGSYIKREINGSLPEQLSRAEEFIRSNLDTTVNLVGLQHQERQEYPFEAVRELLVNAVAHRDYNLQGDNIHLNIYSDRLEVTSPGTLPGPVTLENLLNARFARNAVISQVLSDMGYVERLGYGLDRVVESTRMAGLLPPHFEETAGTFRVTLFAHQQPHGLLSGLSDIANHAALDLNSRQRLALLHLDNQPRITSHQYQLLCPDVHSETLRRDLADMVTRGILIKVGDKKSTYYILKQV
jgi:ATP-dependent DNA helicase RecG